MISYLKSKGISLSPHDYFVNALSFMALGLFASLLMGLILETIGNALELYPLVEMGQFAKDPKLVGAAIGVAVAYSLKAPPLILFSAVVAGAFGGALGGPVGSYITVLVATEIGKITYKLTKVDIIIVPMTVLLVGYAIASFIGMPINQLMQSLGALVNWSTQQQPYLMSMLVATVMGLALTAPISSAAIAFMLGIDGLAAGAAVIGCAAQMVGFASISFKENGVGGWIAQGLGTSMLQIGNVIKNPWLLVAPTLAGLLTAPLAVGIFQMKNNAAGAGMGTSGLVGQFMAFDIMGFSWTTFTLVLVFHLLLPIGLSILIATFLRRKGKIKPGDLKLIYE